MEVCEVGWAEALDEVLLDAAGGGDEAGDVFVLDEVQDDLAQAGGDEVGGVAEEDGAAGVGADARVEEFFRLVLCDGVVGEAPFALCRADLNDGRGREGCVWVLTMLFTTWMALPRWFAWKPMRS